MHHLPRRAASRALTGSSRAIGAFVCPSCAGLSAGFAKTQVPTSTVISAPARRHLSSTAPCQNGASASNLSSPTEAAAAVAPPPPPPSAGYARLTSRRLISIAGVDAAKFLQGIVTSSTLNRAEGFYTGFLNATGRVLHDVFIYPDTLRVGAAAAVAAAAGGGAGDAFIIEVDADQADTLLKHLKRYRLRSKFQLAPVDEAECRVYQVWNDDTGDAGLSLAGSTTSEASTSSSSSSSTRRIILPDTRAPGLGHRVLSTAPASQVTSELESLGLAPATDEAYRIRRYLHGVPEGQGEILRESALPLEANMDLMGGIDFRKGCYVGQELTIRTKHRGVVRKRILPCVVYDGEGGAPGSLEYDPGALSTASSSSSLLLGRQRVTSAEEIPQGSPITKDAARKGRGTGTWLRGVGNVGLALCRLPVMTDVELPGDAAGGGAGSGLASFDPRTEFVVKVEGEGDGEAISAAAEGVGDNGDGQQRQVKIKAFVPPWLRQRLDEANISKH